MRFYIYVLEARNLPVEDTYVKVQIGKFKSKTRMFWKSLNPVWNEEFVFRVHDLDQELVVSVYHHEDDGGFFNASNKILVGRVRIPVWTAVAEENQTLPPTWFNLEKPKTGKFINKDCGRILLTLSLHGRSNETPPNHIIHPHSTVENGHLEGLEDPSAISQDAYSSKASSWKIPEGKHIMKTIANGLEKLFNKTEEPSRTDYSSELSSTLSDYNDCLEEPPSSSSFEEAIEIMQSRDDGLKMPEDLPGGVLLDQMYVVPSDDFNKFLFAPNSQFRKELAELQGTTDLEEGPWTWKSGQVPCLTRVVSYQKAATKLIKAVKAIEEQTYVKAGGGEFAVLVSVSTPDVPYGNTFKVELLYKIMHGPELSSGEETSHLVLSWGVNFSQNTIMKGMIEGGTKQGLKESFDQFADLLPQNLKVVDSRDILDKDQMLASLQTRQQSDWELATKYFCNFAVISTVLMSLYFLVHIMLCSPSKRQGLEFNGLDLPDSFGELVTGGILVIQLERVFNMVSHFVQARLQRGGDNGVRAHGDGWVLTVALIEGINLASLDTTGFVDPYVVFTCNGKTRTSSVKLQTHDPRWNEILEFDAMEKPPSVLDLEVFDFDGPFDQAFSLGYAEINFLKHTSEELADIWVSLEGKLAQLSQSKLHLRIFLDNNNGVETIKEYLTKMEKEVGKKFNLRSPHRNSVFQKLFRLPPDEFLVSDFACSLRRKMPLQGRLFLSARIVGFYAKLFGHKTKFFFLWEDIEDIQVLSPSLASVGSPSLVIVLRKGRGLDARHGAKCLDQGGRLKFYFQSFVSFSEASRTISAIWRTRTLTSDQKAQVEDKLRDFDEKPSVLENKGSVPNIEDLKMAMICSAELPINIKAIMIMFDGGELEHRVMGKAGCLNYETTSWENIKSNLFQRRLSYKFSRHVSAFGGEVNSTQHKTPIPNDNGWIVNEVMALHDVPFCDHFRIHFRYQIEKSVVADAACKCDVYMGIMWLKSTKFQQRINRNIIEKFTHRMKEIFELVEREILLATLQA